MYNYNTVCGKASHSNRSCYANLYLHYSNDAGLLAWHDQLPWLQSWTNSLGQWCIKRIVCDVVLLTAVLRPTPSPFPPTTQCCVLWNDVGFRPTQFCCQHWSVGEGVGWKQGYVWGRHVFIWAWTLSQWNYSTIVACHWILYSIIYSNTKSVFVPIIVLMAPLSQNNRTICWWGDKIYLLTFLFN
jgi:hypothetical protein